MEGSFYLDYASKLRVDYEITDERLDCFLFCESDNERLSKRVVSNLKEVSSIHYIKEEDCFRYSINENIFVDISRTTGEIKYRNKLTAFETRMLAQGKNSMRPFQREDNLPQPKTDLHTHFAGALTADDLITVGLKHNISYPTNLLKEIGIDIGTYQLENQDSILLSQLSEKDINILKDRLKLPIITQETFNKMEEIYKLRGPFTKNKELFPDLLKSLANNYKEMGIEYAELSFSSFLTDMDYMQMIEDTIPTIEQETGVKIRFLAGLWRHSDKEWNLDMIDTIKTIAQSPYIVGCDYMGHETNGTIEFEEELIELAKYAMTYDPNFVIRVHAGENPIFKTNVYDTLKIIYDEHQRMEKETGQKLPMPQVRIGHGLYGLDITEDGKRKPLEQNATLKLAKEMGAIVEFNMSSNLALNNINSIKEVPIKRYIDAGIKVVLGTDGHGLYSTSSQQETVLAHAAGLSREDFQRIVETELEVLKKAKERELSHPNIQDVPALYQKIKYATDDGSPHYTDEVVERHKIEDQKAEETLKEQLKAIDTIVDEDAIIRDTDGKVPIMITGASKSNWPNISPVDQEKIKLTMQVLANTLNPETTYIVTGGTNFGVEKTMHEAVNRRNKQSEKSIVLLGTLTMESVRNKQMEVEPNTITHATILEMDGHKVKNWMDLPDTQLVHVKERNGEMIAVGGGSIVSDMIQRAYNLGVKMHLMDGPYGASTNKSRSMSGNDYSFSSIQELLTNLYYTNPTYFGEDFSLDKISEYIEEAQKMINLDSMRTERNMESELQDMLGDNQKENKTEEYESDLQQMLTIQEKPQQEKTEAKTA